MFGRLAGLVRVPANRIGFTQFNVGQLKIMQEVITLAVFVPFAVFYMGQPLKWDYLWAGLCLVGAVYFIFRGAGRRKAEAGVVPPSAARDPVRRAASTPCRVHG